MTDESLACALAVVIRRACDAAGLSGREAARQSGTSRATPWTWGGTPSREPSLPSLRTLAAIARALGTSPGRLLIEAEAEAWRDEGADGGDGGGA